MMGHDQRTLTCSSRGEDRKLRSRAGRGPARAIALSLRLVGPTLLVVGAWLSITPAAWGNSPRGFELVTPAGSGDYSTSFQALGGGTVFFSSDGAIAGTPASGGSGLNGVPQRLFAASRSASGWETSSLTNFSLPNPAELGEGEFIGSAADWFGAFFTTANALVAGTGENVNLYVSRPGESPTLISHDEAGAPGNGLNFFCGLVGVRCALTAPAIVSGDGLHVMFASNTPLTAAAKEVPLVEEGTSYLYESDADGNVTLVSAMSDGKLPAGGHGAYLGAAHSSSAVTNSVSADGSTVFFASEDRYDPSVADTGPQVFMHHDGETIDVSASQTGTPGTSSRGARFDAASAEGAKVVFSDCSELTADDHNGEFCSTGQEDIFEYDVTTGALTRISKGEEGLEDSGGAGGGVFLAMSADGSHVFFASFDQLDPSGPAQDPENLAPFLYESAGGHVRYIATLSSPDLDRLQRYGNAQSRGTAAQGPIRTATDGNYLVFESERALTPDDDNEEAGRLNVYEYDTVTAALTRVSQGSLPGSGNGPHSATIGSQQQHPGFGGSADGDLELEPYTFGDSQLDGRVMTEEGAVFFSSREALAAGASDGPLHVYEWKGGSTYLISPAGPDATDAHYLENSPGGADVYFSTQQEVLPGDSDGEGVDIYDAREGGGFPESAPAACQGEACQGTVPPAPSLGAPLSATFGGAGNLAPPAQSKPATAPKPRTRPLTRAQKLARALRACRAQRSGRRRVGCEARARRRYGPRSNAGQGRASSAKPRTSTRGTK